MARAPRRTQSRHLEFPARAKTNIRRRTRWLIYIFVAIKIPMLSDRVLAFLLIGLIMLVGAIVKYMCDGDQPAEKNGAEEPAEEEKTDNEDEKTEKPDPQSDLPSADE